VAAVAAGLEKRKSVVGASAAQAPDADVFDLLPRRALLERVTWADAQGQRITLDGDARLGDDGRIDSVSVQVIDGRFKGARGRLAREADHWPLDVQIGGGRVAGRFRLQASPRGVRTLAGEFDTRDVEVSALTAPRRPLTGKLQAQTTLRADFRDPATLVEVLQTRTQFTVQDAVLNGIDLARAVQTIGLSRGGVTALDTLAGQVVTQGRVVQLNNLVASSGALAATGHVAIAANKTLSGRVTVDLATAKGALGIPLAVGGTVDSPSVTLTRGALLGAAVGTAVAPGLGTGAGAAAGDRLGERLRGLFGK
jgi:hypothetical protein